MRDRAETPEVLSLALKGQQWAAARRRHEAALQAEVRRLARAARRTAREYRDASNRERDPSNDPAA